MRPLILFLHLIRTLRHMQVNSYSLAVLYEEQILALD